MAKKSARRKSTGRTGGWGQEWNRLVTRHPQLKTGVVGLAVALPESIVLNLGGTPEVAQAEKAFTALCRKHGCTGVAAGQPWTYSLLLPDTFRGEGEPIYCRARAYAGELLCSPDFFSQWQDFKAQAGLQLTYPLPRPIMPPGVGSVDALGHVKATFWAFSMNWCLDGMAWDGLPQPVLPMAPIFGAPQVLAQYASLGLFIMLPWYYDLGKAATVPSRENITGLQKKRDHGIEELSQLYGSKKRRIGNYGSPVDDFFMASYAALRAREDPALMKRKKSGTNVTLEDLLHGNPALRPGVRVQRDVDLHERAFLYTIFCSAVLSRHPSIPRMLLGTAVEKGLSASDRTIRRVRKLLSPTSTERKAVGLIHP